MMRHAIYNLGIILSLLLHAGFVRGELQQQGALPICNTAPGGDDPASTCSLIIEATAEPLLQFLGRWELDTHRSFTIPFPRLLSTSNGNMTKMSFECTCSGGADCNKLHANTSLDVFPAAAQFDGVPVMSVLLAPPVGQCTTSSCSVTAKSTLVGGVPLQPGSAVLRFGPEPPAPAPVSTSPPYALCHSTWKVMGPGASAELRLTNKWTPKFDNQFCISTEKLALPGSSLVAWECDCHIMDCRREMAATKLQVFAPVGSRTRSESGNRACAAESQNLTFSPLSELCSADACQRLAGEGPEVASTGMQMCFAQATLV
ncbi:unnamed protein product [Polarella glacialis]|uniref:Uncharacterized protein n=1 Tax=Polarella glacialis TaxID=89957 RepID=A0A813FD42_POLGL|nr:unnamed protein product [Polarella glacialis]CAE8718765.1 unnamed protein product [Polarella glacialis]